MHLPRKRKAQEEEQDEEEDTPEFYFFHFECRQEEAIHVPNLVVVKVMCNKEKIFRGDDTRDAFCQWLFQDKHADSIWIAHNLKGYDVYFVYLYDNAIMPHVILNGAKVMQIQSPGSQHHVYRQLEFLHHAPLQTAPGVWFNGIGKRVLSTFLQYESK